MAFPFDIRLLFMTILTTTNWTTQNLETVPITPYMDTSAKHYPSVPTSLLYIYIYIYIYISISDYCNIKSLLLDSCYNSIIHMTSLLNLTWVDIAASEWMLLYIRHTLSCRYNCMRRNLFSAAWNYPGWVRCKFSISIVIKWAFVCRIKGCFFCLLLSTIPTMLTV